MTEYKNYSAHCLECDWHTAPDYKEVAREQATYHRRITGHETIDGKIVK